jgi:hypothetical protein
VDSKMHDLDPVVLPAGSCTATVGWQHGEKAALGQMIGWLHYGDRIEQVRYHWEPRLDGMDRLIIEPIKEN